MFSRFQHLERWRFQPYADREDPFKRTYLTRDKLIWRWYCSRIEPPQFCSFWGGGGKRPVRGPTDKVEQGKCLCERWVSVKAGTGRRSLLTSEGKDFPKPLCKTTADPAADSGTQAAAACSAARPALKTHWLPPPRLSSSLSSCTIHGGKTTKPRRSWQAGGKAEAAITLPIRSVWNVATLYCMWTDTFVMSDTTTGRRGGFSCQQHLRSLPGNRS